MASSLEKDPNKRRKRKELPTIVAIASIGALFEFSMVRLVKYGSGSTKLWKLGQPDIVKVCSGETQSREHKHVEL